MVLVLVLPLTHHSHWIFDREVKLLSSKAIINKSNKGKSEKRQKREKHHKSIP